jgi:hypothetical protein
MKLSSGCDRQREDPDASLGLDFHFENARLWITLGALAYRDDIADEHGSSHSTPFGGHRLTFPWCGVSVGPPSFHPVDAWEMATWLDHNGINARTKKAVPTSSVRSTTTGIATLRPRLWFAAPQLLSGVSIRG